MPDSAVERRVPTPGPRPYTDDMSDVFFGRDREIGMIFDRVQGQRLSVLDAESASGKTSLLQAGLMPRLRQARLAALAEVSARPIAFPLLLNQWLGRAGLGKGAGYIGLLVAECHRFLESSMPWYEAHLTGACAEDQRVAEREMARIAAARDGLRVTAERLSLATYDTAEGVLVPVASQGDATRDDRQMIRDLMECLDALTEHFGSILLVLDQFEEVLGDPVIGGQAIVAVESVFQVRKKDIHQFISLRNDALYLLEPLERKSILENKRRVSIRKLDARAVKPIVLAMCQAAGHTWSDEASLERLVATFTKHVPRWQGGSDVNLLGLQVVLEGLLSSLVYQGASDIGLDDVRRYCASLASSSMPFTDDTLDRWLDRHPDPESSGAMRNGLLSDFAPRAWIEMCLDGSVEAVGGDSERGKDAEVLPEQVKPMVMRMAAWLVTPAGFKRPMTLRELEEVSYGGGSDNRAIAGRAVAQGWDCARLDTALGLTCVEALDRLVAGHVLKKRGGSSGTSYELVHDQFGRPLQAWAEDFRKTPEADLGSPYEITDKAFPWNGPLKSVLQEAVLESVVWDGCTVTDVDFSGLRIQNCGFPRTLFVNCVFDNAVLDRCDLSQAVFENCRVENTVLKSCTLESTAVRMSSVFQRVSVVGGTMRFADLMQSTFSDCVFEGTADEPLGMRNLQMIDCSLLGANTFRYCTLDGATLGSELMGTGDGQTATKAGDLSFTDCSLLGAEINSLDFLDGSLQISRSSARGAVFHRVRLASSSPGKVATSAFASVDLTGAVFLGCELRDVKFSGSDGVSAATLVFRPIDAEDAQAPSIIGDVEFVDMNLENAGFNRCQFVGPVAFERCGLSGATFTGAESDGTARVGGTLTFRDRCDLAALELDTLDFSEFGLDVIGCAAPGALFLNVTIEASGQREFGAQIVDTQLPGAVFLGCRIHDVRFESTGEVQSSFETLLMRGMGGFRSEIGRCEFLNVYMENFTLADTEIDGRLHFSACALAGGTIGNRNDGPGCSPEPMRVSGDLIFADGCDISALEISNTRLEDGAVLRVQGGTCRGALIEGLVAPGVDGGPSVVMESVDLSGSVFLDCALEHAVFIDNDDDGLLTPAWGLVMKGVAESARVGQLRFEGYDLDGGSFNNVVLLGSMIFQDCSLLRTQIADVTGGNDEAFIDVRSSDLLYAEIDEDRMGAEPPQADGSRVGDAPPILRLLPGQWVAARAVAEGRKHLRFLGRKV